MKHDYTKLDAAIIAVLRDVDRPQMSWKLWADSRIKQACVTITDVVNVGRGYWQRMPEHAPLDRRLQALRKAGRIAYQRKHEGWVLAKEE